MKEISLLSIGFDDTDSPKGMCTTYLAYKMVDLLKKENVQFLDFPYLIRFNPNIPWKTRGNGAVGLKIKTTNPARIKKKVTDLVKKYSDTKNGANPGLVFYEKEKIPLQLKEFSKLAMWQLVQRNHAKEFAKKHGIETFYLGNGQGLVGAIGAISYDFEDHTMELLSYRQRSKFGTKREIQTDSVKKMQQQTYPYTFNSYDDKKRRILITPHGPDPVFFGIRGESPSSLLHASKLIKTKERPEGYLLFKSNQGTSDHLKNKLDSENLKPYSSGMITGFVSVEPKMQKGGHVFFSICTKNKEILCAVYKETGFSKFVLNLIKGDKICVGGGIRKASKNHSRVLNVEFFKIIKLATKIIPTNPYCFECKKKMKSKGQNQGYQCVKCGKKSKNKTGQKIPRQIKKKMYIPIISAHRHLTRPEQRIGIKNKETRFNQSLPWFCVFSN